MALGVKVKVKVTCWKTQFAYTQVLYGSPQVLTDVAMATNFGTKIAITGFVRTIATRQLAMQGV